MKKQVTITIKKIIYLCDYCNKELPERYTVKWEGKEYHVGCFEEKDC
jgi:hypothetical protein